MSLVFISYASDESRLAESLCAGLEERGVRCWIAPRDIPAGHVYADAIVAAIDAASAFVLMLTPAANDSDHVFRELELAAAGACRVVPVVVGGVRPSRRLRFYVGPTQWLAADAHNFEPGIDALAVALREQTEAMVDVERGHVS